MDWYDLRTEIRTKYQEIDSDVCGPTTESHYCRDGNYVTPKIHQRCTDSCAARWASFSEPPNTNTFDLSSLPREVLSEISSHVNPKDIGNLASTQKSGPLHIMAIEAANIQVRGKRSEKRQQRKKTLRMTKREQPYSLQRQHMKLGNTCCCCQKQGTIGVEQLWDIKTGGQTTSAAIHNTCSTARRNHKCNGIGVQVGYMKSCAVKCAILSFD